MKKYLFYGVIIVVGFVVLSTVYRAYIASSAAGSV